MISFYNDVLYGWNLLDFLFLYFCYMHLLKFRYFLSIGSLLWFFFLLFWDNIHGLSLHFYLYNVREENTLHFEIFERSFLFSVIAIFLYNSKCV